MSAGIGIDIGSSAIKGVLLCDGEIISSLRQPIPIRVLVGNHGMFEHDAVTIRNRTFEIVQFLAKNKDVRAIALTGQMHGGLLVDERFEPCTNFVTWQDLRENPAVETLRTALGDDPTGVGIHSGFLISTLAWWNANGAIPSNARYALGIYDWIASLLAGRATTDIGSAAAWGMFDPNTKQWRNRVIDAAGISRSLLPQVLEPGAVIGKIEPSIASELGLLENITIHAGTGDTQATYIGSLCLTGDLLLNFGTGSQSIWETSNPIATPGTDIRYLHSGKFIATAPAQSGGEAYRITAEFLRGVLREFGGLDIPIDAMFERMNALASNSSSRGIRFDPLFLGSKFRPDADRGSIAGLTKDNFHPGPLVRALIEGMIDEVTEPYFVREGRGGPRQLIGAGSAMRMNPALRKVAEMRFGLPLTLAPYSEEAALGVARLAAMATKT